MPTFKTKERYGKQIYELHAWIGDRLGGDQYSSPQLEGLKFDTYAKLIEAIKKKELDDKKGFKNPTAYMFSGWDYRPEDKKVLQVKVTSLHYAQHAWVTRPGGKRGVERLESLYTNKEAMEDYIKFEKTHSKMIKDEYKNLEHWTPQA